MQPSTDIINLTKRKVASTPLSTLVKETVEHYFSDLNGHDTAGLHALVMSEAEKPLIEVTLAYCGQNQTKASKILGLSRSTLRKKIGLYGLDSTCRTP